MSLKKSKPKALILGGSGLLGNYCCEILKNNYQITATTHKQENQTAQVNFQKIDVTDTNELKKLIKQIAPSIIINAIAYTDVDGSEKNQSLALALNANLPLELTQICNGTQTKIIHISTDQLFDGKKQSAYTENDTPCPVNFYAQSKALGEKNIGHYQNHLIIRTNFFGKGHPWRISFSDWLATKLRSGEQFAIHDDVHFNPMEINRLIFFIDELIKKDEKGIWNIGTKKPISKFDFALKVAEKLNINSNNLLRSKLLENKNAIPRPSHMHLSVDKIESRLNCAMPTIDECFSDLTFLP